MAGKTGGAGRLLEDAQVKLAARLMKLAEAVEAEPIPADAAGRDAEAKRLGVMSRAGAALALMQQRNERARNERLAGELRRKLARAQPQPAPAAASKHTKETDERRAGRIERLQRIAEHQIASLERELSGGGVRRRPCGDQPGDKPAGARQPAMAGAIEYGAAAA